MKKSGLFLIVMFMTSMAWALDYCQYNGKAIASLQFESLKATRPNVVHRELVHEAGKGFSCEVWEKEKKKLLSLDLFSDITLNIQEESSGLSLKYQFVELQAFLVFPAFKKTDQNGIVAGPGFAFLNLLGQDIRLEGYARYAIEADFLDSQEYLFVLSSPWIGNVPIEYVIGLVISDSYNPLKEYAEQSINFKAEGIYRYTEAYQFLASLETFSVKNDGEADIFYNEDDDFVPKVGGGFIIDTRDTRFNPHYGLYQEWRISKFGGFLGGDSDYEEYLWDTRFFHTINKKHIVHVSLLAQYRPGDVGYYEYFNVGGANTLRAYQALPQYIGQHEILGTLEYRFEQIERIAFSLWGMNGYYGLQWLIGSDWAKMWEKDDFSDGKLYNGTYIGLHILLPGVDRARFEYGLQTNSWKATFSFGLFEKSTVQRWRVR